MPTKTDLIGLVLVAAGFFLGLFVSHKLVDDEPKREPDFVLESCAPTADGVEIVGKFKNLTSEQSLFEAFVQVIDDDRTVVGEARFVHPDVPPGLDARSTLVVEAERADACEVVRVIRDPSYTVRLGR